VSGNALVTDDCPVCRGPAERPADVLAALSAMPEMLARAIEDASGRGDGWDARFVAVHLADLEVSRGWRFRQILAEDDPEIGVLDQDAYAERLQYSERSLELALETFASNRRANVELLRLAGDEARSRTYRHAVFGKMTLGQLINHTAHHDRAHLRQIRGDSA
jgi:hypothetical protein